MSAAAQHPMSDPITIKTLEPLPCWVAWQTEDREGGEPTKVPYSPSGMKAKADVPATWGTRAAAEAMAAKLPKPYGSGGVGIEFTTLDDGRSLAGIDLDSCRNPETGATEDWAADIVKRFATYTEISPSGTGLKCFFTYTATDLPKLRAVMGGAAWGKQFKRQGGEHPPAIELYIGSRYFAVTDHTLPGWFAEFSHIDTARLLELIQVIGPAFVSGNAERTNTGTGAGTAQRKRSGQTDRSRSGIAFSKGKRLRREGATYAEMVAQLRSDPETAEWVRDKGDANGQRELRRIWERAEPKGTLIRVVAGELHEAATAAEGALIEAGLPIYQRGDALVRPITREVPASRGRMTVAAGLSEMNVFSLVDVLCATAEWEKFDARANDWIRINPPSQVAHILLARQGLWRFPKIAGVITTPTLRPNGSLLTEAGYDPATRLYHAADPTLHLHPAVHAPTRAAAEGALAALAGLLTEFPFVKMQRPGEPPQEVSRAVALSGLITPIVRGALPVAPLHAFNAPTPGSGKSYLVDTASMLATGRACPVISAAPDEAETEKRIAGLLLAGYPIVSIDNVNGELGGDLLCQAVERPLIRIRRLGASDIIEIESVVTMYATGNNVRVRGDMVRRSLVAELDAQLERPELRRFSGDPVLAIQADRGRYVSAALVIVRAYIAAGMPGKLPPIASFDRWSDLVRSALVWLGCADPALSMEQAREDDPELTELTEVLTAWASALGTGHGRTVRQVAEEVAARTATVMGEPTEYRFPELRDVLLRVAGERGEVSTKRLGRWLAAREGRIVNGLRFSKVGAMAHGGLPRWGVLRVA